MPSHGTDMASLLASGLEVCRVSHLCMDRLLCGCWALSVSATMIAWAAAGGKRRRPCGVGWRTSTGTRTRGAGASTRTSGPSTTPRRTYPSRSDVVVPSPACSDYRWASHGLIRVPLCVFAVAHRRILGAAARHDFFFFFVGSLGLERLFESRTQKP